MSMQGGRWSKKLKSCQRSLWTAPKGMCSNADYMYYRAVIRFSNLRVLIVIDCLFLFLSFFLNRKIPGVQHPLYWQLCIIISDRIVSKHRFYQRMNHNKLAMVVWILWGTLLQITEDGRFMTTFYYYSSCKSSIWFTEKHIFKIIIYFFNTLKCAKIMSFNLRYMIVS